MNAEEIRGRILEHMGECPEEWMPTQGEMGAMNGAITKAIDPKKEQKSFLRENWRRMLLAYLFGADAGHSATRSSKTLTPGQWYSLFRWIDWWKDEEMVWQVSEAFLTEAPVLCAQVVHEAEECERKLIEELCPYG